MGLKIDNSSLFSRRFLKLKPDRVRFYEPGMMWGARNFRFTDIACVLISPSHLLSFQVGNEVYSIQTKPNRPKHQATISALVAAVEASRPTTDSAVRHDSVP